MEHMGYHFSGDNRSPLTILGHPLLSERQVRGRWLVDSLPDKGTFQTTSYQAKNNYQMPPCPLDNVFKNYKPSNRLYHHFIDWTQTFCWNLKMTRCLALAISVMLTRQSCSFGCLSFQVGNKQQCHLPELLGLSHLEPRLYYSFWLLVFLWDSIYPETRNHGMIQPACRKMRMYI